MRVHQESLGKRVLQGVGMALFLTAFRAVTEGSSGLPVWTYAVLFLGVSVGGAVGGAAYYATDSWRYDGGWRKTTANVASILVFAAVTVGALLLVALFVPELSK